MFGQVPALPVVIPLAAALFLLLLWRLHAPGRLTLARAAVAAVLAVYAGGVVANTVFPIYLAWPHSDAPDPLSLNLIPFAGYEVEDALTNILVFVPLGLLAPLLLRRPTWWRVLLLVAAGSLAIEVVQLITSDLAGGGHIADINDWFFNTLGGALGFALLTLLMRSPALARRIELLRWAPRAEGDA